MKDLKYWAFIHQLHIYGVVEKPASIDYFRTDGIYKTDYGSQYTYCRLGKSDFSK